MEDPAFYILMVEMKYPAPCDWPHIFTQFLGAWSTVEKCIEKANEDTIGAADPSYNNGQPIVWNDPVGFWDGKSKSDPVEVVEGTRIKRTDTYIILRCWKEDTDLELKRN